MNPVHIDEKLSKDNRSYYKKETMYSYSVTHDSLSFYLKQGLIMPLSKTQAWTNKSTILTENDVKMINYECSLLKYIPVQYQNDSSSLTNNTESAIQNAMNYNPRSIWDIINNLKNLSIKLQNNRKNLLILCILNKNNIPNDLNRKILNI